MWTFFHFSAEVPDRPEMPVWDETGSLPTGLRCLSGLLLLLSSPKIPLLCPENAHGNLNPLYV